MKKTMPTKPLALRNPMQKSQQDKRDTVMLDTLLAKQKTPTIISVVLVSMLSACNHLPLSKDTALPEPQVQLPMHHPYDVNDMAERMGLNQRQENQHINQPSIASERWQSFYADKKLKALINLALENNRDLQATLLAIKQSQAQYNITKAKDLPALVANAGLTHGATHSQDKNPSTTYNVGLGMAQYELDMWGKISNMKAQALQNFLATRAGKDAVQISLISNIAQVYVNYSFALEQLSLASSTVDNRTKTLDINKTRFDAGLDSKLPTLQARTSLKSAKLSVLEAKSNLLKLKNAMQLLVGKHITEQMLPTQSVQRISRKNVFSTGLPSELLLYRPDITQAEYQLKAANANIKVARANFLPSISLTSNLGYASVKLSDLFKSGSFSWSVAPAVSLPIFDAGQIQTNYELAKIQQQQALNTYEKSIETAFKEVSDVLADRATINKRLRIQQELQNDLVDTYDIAAIRYKEGFSNYLGVLDAERALFSNRQAMLQLKQAKLITQIQLYQALGGGVSARNDVTTDAASRNAAHDEAAKALETTNASNSKE